MAANPGHASPAGQAAQLLIGIGALAQRLEQAGDAPRQAAMPRTVDPRRPRLIAITSR